MTLRQIAAAAGALEYLLSAGALAEDSDEWVRIKDPQNLRAT